MSRKPTESWPWKNTLHHDSNLEQFEGHQISTTEIDNEIPSQQSQHGLQKTSGAKNPNDAKAGIHNSALILCM